MLNRKAEHFPDISTSCKEQKWNITSGWDKIHLKSNSGLWGFYLASLDLGSVIFYTQGLVYNISNIIIHFSPHTTVALLRNSSPSV